MRSRSISLLNPAKLVAFKTPSPVSAEISERMGQQKAARALVSKLVDELHHDELSSAIKLTEELRGILAGLFEQDRDFEERQLVSALETSIFELSKTIESSSTEEMLTSESPLLRTIGTKINNEIQKNVRK